MEFYNWLNNYIFSCLFYHKSKNSIFANLKQEGKIIIYTIYNIMRIGGLFCTFSLLTISLFVKLNAQVVNNSYTQLMNDSCISRFKIEQNDNGDLLASGTIISYKFSHYQTQNGTSVPCLIKSKTIASEWLHHVSHDKSYQVTLTIFPDYDQASAFSYSKATQIFELKENYLIAANYGCCDNPTYYELSTFPSNETFLICNKRYHKIVIPSTMKVIFLGYQINQDSATLAEGLLGHINYSINQQDMRSIAIYNSDPEIKCLQMPEIKLYSQYENDIINDSDSDYDLMYAISQQGEVAARLWKGIGISATFYESKRGNKRKEAHVVLEFKDGNLGEDPIKLQFQKPTK